MADFPAIKLFIPEALAGPRRRRGPRLLPGGSAKGSLSFIPRSLQCRQGRSENVFEPLEGPHGTVAGRRRLDPQDLDRRSLRSPYSLTRQRGTTIHTPGLLVPMGSN